VFSLAVAAIVSMATSVVTNSAIPMGLGIWVQLPLLFWSVQQARAIALHRSHGWKWHPVLAVSAERIALARRSMWVALSLPLVSFAFALLLDHKTSQRLLPLYLSIWILPASLYLLFHWAFRPENFLTDKALFRFFHPASPLAPRQRTVGAQEALPSEWLANAVPYLRAIAEDKLAERTRGGGDHFAYHELHDALFDRLKTAECLGYYTMEPALKTALSRFVRAIRKLNNDAAQQPSLLDYAVLKQSEQWREVRAAANEVVRTLSAQRH
jgi:hypothetical protein